MARLWRTVADPSEYPTLADFARAARGTMLLERYADQDGLTVEETTPDGGYHEFFVDVPEDKLFNFLMQCASTSSDGFSLEGSTVDVSSDYEAEQCEIWGFAIGDDSRKD